MGVFIQPAGGPDAIQHFRNTVEGLVDVERLSKFISKADTEKLRLIYGDRSVAIWGLVPGAGKRNRKIWTEMEPGSLVLFTGQNKLFASGVVTHRLENRPLARELWGTNHAGQTWELVFFLDDIRRSNVPYEAFNAAAGYSRNFVPRGSMRLDDERAASVLAALDLDAAFGTRAVPVAPEIQDTLNLIAEQAGKRKRGQGFRVSPEARRAIEEYAMECATTYFKADGWTTVTDVSARESYDLLCRRRNQELRVEVKGTTGDGTEVLLTRKEESHAREFSDICALFVVGSIKLNEETGKKPAASGGENRLLRPWRISDGKLKTLGWVFSLPPKATQGK